MMPNMVLDKEPLTGSAPANLTIGAGAAGFTNYGVQAMAGEAWPNAVAVLLNLIMQPAKKYIPLLRHHEVAIIVMLVVSFVLLYFIVFNHDAAQAIKDAAYSTLQAIANYKSDKLSGLNIMAPAED